MQGAAISRLHQLVNEFSDQSSSYEEKEKNNLQHDNPGLNLVVIALITMGSLSHSTLPLQPSKWCLVNVDTIFSS